MKIEEAVKDLESQLHSYDCQEECGSKILATAPFNREAVRTLLEGYEAAMRFGTWKPVGFVRGRGGNYKCTACESQRPIMSKFCPNCGAEMSGPEPGGEECK